MVAGTLPALLGACGFSPLYARGAGGGEGAAVTGLSEITVAIIPERAGQLLRQALQARFYGAGTARARLYELKTVFGISADAIAIRQDNTSTRSRLIGAASWTLTAADPAQGTVASGTARVVDGYNIFDQQYFAADLENEAVQRRIAEATADRIAQQLATFFKKNGSA